MLTTFAAVVRTVRRKVRLCFDCGSECNATVVYSFLRGPGDWIKICAGCRAKRIEAMKPNAEAHASATKEPIA